MKKLVKFRFATVLLFQKPFDHTSIRARPAQAQRHTSLMGPAAP